VTFAITAALLGLGSLVYTQDQTPQFRGGATLVYVDAYPRVDGKVVEGLTAADFEVAENGRTHAIESFQFISVRQNVPDEERRDPTSPADSLRQVADPNNRVFLIYLDIDHTTIAGSHATQQPIVEFLTRTIGPTDLFAVTTAETSLRRLTFGRRTETIADELRRYWAWGEGERLRRMPRNEAEARLGQCVASRPDADAALELLLKVYRDDRLFTSLEELLPELRALREGRKNFVLVSEGWLPEGPQQSLLNLVKGATPSPIGTLPSGRLGRVADQPGSIDYSWCDGQIARLAAIDFEQRYRDILRDARRSNVTFYPIDVGGLRPSAVGSASMRSSGDAAAADRSQWRGMNVLRELADATDGMAVVNTNDLTGAVRRVSDSLAGYYLLGYAPTDQRADGRFREIRVRVKRPNVTVSARQGYFAPSAADRNAMAVAANAAAARPSVDTSVSSAIDALSRARPDAELLVHAARRAGGIDVIVELGAAPPTGRTTTGGAVDVSARLAGSAPVTASGHFDVGARSIRLTLPVGAVASADLAAPVVIEARVSGQAGQVARTDLPANVGKVLGEPLLFRATPSPRSVPRPTANPQYSRTERLHIECPVAGDAQVTARLLDARGQPLPVTPTVTLSGEGADRLASADVNLSALGEGSYLLEIAADTAGERRLVAFRVVR
jgi:VWFA-related protein